MLHKARSTRIGWLRFIITLCMSFLLLAVMIFGLLGANSSFARPFRINLALNEHSWVSFISQNGCLGVVVIESENKAVISSIESGRAYLPVFLDPAGRLQFRMSLKKGVDWYYAPDSSVTACDLRWQHFTAYGAVRRSDIYFPSWCAVGFLSVLPLFWFIRHLSYISAASRRRASGACESCGYDLLHILSDVCPECGATYDRIELIRRKGMQDDRHENRLTPHDPSKRCGE